MPLSEQEQRLLEEMERSLYHNDADFVAGSAAHGSRPTYSMVAAGVLIGTIGVAALIAGVVIRVPFVGVIGFILMFVGVLVAVTPARTPRAHAPSPRGAAGSASGSSANSGEDDRWGKNTQEPPAE